MNNSSSFALLQVLNDDKNLTVIARYCGSSLPKPVVSAGHTMRVRFHSNSNRSSNGFEAMFTTVGTGERISTFCCEN